MRINHNIMALNSWRNLSQNAGALGKSLERLSSGLRINRAADDAAGLAISEKMRAQINGLRMAQRNGQDAISLIQTAEGALNEAHAILQRTRELAVQASSDTMTAEDQAKLQAEVDRLVQELGRIGDTTEFNTKKLLDGTFAGTFQIGANEGQNLHVSIGDMRAQALGVVGNGSLEASGTLVNTNSSWDAVDGETLQVTYSKSDEVYQLVDSEGLVIATSSDGKVYGAAADGNGTDRLTFLNAVKHGTVTIDVAGTTTASHAEGVNSGLEAGTYTVDVNNRAILDAEGNAVATAADGSSEFKDAAGTTLYTLDISDDVDDGAELVVAGVSITAPGAIAKVEGAIDLIANQRSDLGAVQNRLEHTIANLGVAEENLQAAESRIRDADMASEMAEFTRAQILQQAATAMLAQANVVPQTVLQLLG